jgi:site-specific recombinase XerD
MGGPRRAAVVGPLEEHAAGYAAELKRQGYVPRVVELQGVLLADLSVWLGRQGLDASGLSVAMAEVFMAARRDAGCVRYVSTKSLAALFGYLRGLGVTPPPSPAVPADAVEVVLDRFGSYLKVERGLTTGTVGGYVAAVRPFVAGRKDGDRVDLSGVTAADVSAFVVAVCPARPPGPAKVIVTAMRSLLAFLYLEGTLPVALAASVPSVASWRLAALPRPLTAGQVRALLGSCDRRTSVGRRDFAMLVVLSRLGLRAGEVARLGLDDIGWRAGEVVVVGKGPKLERLPLPADVGEAIAGYLQRGRPPTAQGRSVFVRVQAPHRALTAGGVTQAVFAAGQRAGLGAVYAHRLRSSAASEMLRAGATLPEIGLVLRHRRVLTTAIYAKVDTETLRQVAAPWPGSGR